MLTFFLTFTNNNSTISGECGNYNPNGDPYYECRLSTVNTREALFPAGDCSMSIVIQRNGTLVSAVTYPEPVFFQPYVSNMTTFPYQIYDGAKMIIEGGFVPTFMYSCNFQFVYNNGSTIYSVFTVYEDLETPTRFSCVIPNGTWDYVKQTAAFTITVLQTDANSTVTVLPMGNQLQFRFYYEAVPVSTTGTSTTGGKSSGLKEEEIVYIACGVGGVFLLVAVVAVVFYIRKRKHGYRKL